MSLLGKLFEHGNVLSGDHTRRRCYVGTLTPSGPDADPAYEALKGDRFAPEESYFSVRLVEMRLAAAGTYLTTFLPMCSCFLRYTFGNAVRQVPFIVGYDMIRAELKQESAGAQNVEFKNIYIVRNAPVKVDGLLMYTALCRIADSSFAKGMLDLLVDAAGAIGGPAAGVVARAGGDLTKRLGGLLGADGVSTRFGVLDGSALQRSGYRVFAGATSDGLDAKELSIEQGQLLRAQSDGSTKTIDDVDYLVVALEYRRTLVEDGVGAISILPFHALWEPVKAKLLAADLAGADDAYKELTLRVASSPDLVEADRLGIIATYRAQLEKWKKLSATGSILRAAAGQDITARLADMAADRRGSMTESVRSLLLTASHAIATQRNRRPEAPEAMLESAALMATARAVRTEIDQRRAGWEDLARASAQIASAALSTPL